MYTPLGRNHVAKARRYDRHRPTSRQRSSSAGRYHPENRPTYRQPSASSERAKSVLRRKNVEAREERVVSFEPTHKSPHEELAVTDKVLHAIRKASGPDAEILPDLANTNSKEKRISITESKPWPKRIATLQRNEDREEKNSIEASMSLSQRVAA